MADKATITQKVTVFINGELNEINNMDIDIFEKTLDKLKQQDFKYKDIKIFLENIVAPTKINIAKDEKLGRTRFTNIRQEYVTLAQKQWKVNKQSYTIQSTVLKDKPKIAIITNIGSVLNNWKKGDPPITDLYKLSSKIKENYIDDQKKQLLEVISTELFNAIKNFIDVLITFKNDLSEKIEAQKNKWKTLYGSLLAGLVERLNTIDVYLKSKKKTENDNTQSGNKVELYEKAFKNIEDQYFKPEFNQEELKKIMTPILNKNLNDMLLYGHEIMEKKLYPENIVKKANNLKNDKEFMLCLYSLNLNLVKLSSINNVGASSKMDELLTIWLKAKNAKQLERYTNVLKKIGEATYSKYILTDWILNAKNKKKKEKLILPYIDNLLIFLKQNDNNKNVSKISTDKNLLNEIVTKHNEIYPKYAMYTQYTF